MYLKTNLNENEMSDIFNTMKKELIEKDERSRLDELKNKYGRTPNIDYTNMCLRDELQTRFDLQELNNLQQKYPEVTPTYATTKIPQAQYGNATAKALDNYIKDYQYRTGTVCSGLVAPINDMIRNYDTMKDMELKESDPFFHCKANYEAASRGIYGTAVANAIDLGKEARDIFVKKYPISDSIRDYRANLRGQRGAFNGQTLEETCPTHHKFYE